METGRFQPAMRTSAKAVLSRSRFSRVPFGAEGLSVSFVRAAYEANDVKQNPGDITFRRYNVQYKE
ncbi:hypothetical protein [Desulfitobacterium hafniense]|uniref:hypothetical protein n=1 Tax=Desulfitobacterium hafniense TaxID=49338 RepID=UPI0009B72A1C|nr:hypothetical protein [Desulfitobacterium hafniense]